MTAATVLRHLSAEEVTAAVPAAEAVTLLQDALRDGLDPAQDADRTVVHWRSGQLLMMPAEHRARAGVKLALVADQAAGSDLPRIQGVYVLLDADTFVPLVTMDGPALTSLRTPAVTVAAIEPLLRAGSSPLRVVVVGRGVQARGHARTLVAALQGVRPVASVTFLGRAGGGGGLGELAGVLPGSAGARLALAFLGTAEADAVLREADVVVCATSAEAPLFDSSLLRPDVVVAAVGSHEPGKREVDGTLMARSHVVVEDRSTALREAGDVIQAVAEGLLEEDRLVTMADLVGGRVVLARDRPVVFKGTGMSWQDLVIADVVHRRSSRPHPGPADASADPGGRG